MDTRSDAECIEDVAHVIVCCRRREVIQSHVSRREMLHEQLLPFGLGQPRIPAQPGGLGDPIHGAGMTLSFLTKIESRERDTNP